MIRALQTFVRFLWTRSVTDWRSHRTACRNLLPRAERKEVTENGE